MVCYDGFISWKSKFNKSGEDTVTDISEETSHMCLFTSERESPQAKVLVFINIGFEKTTNFIQFTNWNVGEGLLIMSRISSKPLHGHSSLLVKTITLVISSPFSGTIITISFHLSWSNSPFLNPFQTFMGRNMRVFHASVYPNMWPFFYLLGF